MIHMPGQTDTGIRTQKLVEFVDIFPTLVELSGFPFMEQCPEESSHVDLCTEGSSLVPLVSDPEELSWKDSVFWQFRRGEKACKDCEHIYKIMGYTIRTEKYRLTEWVGLTLLGGNDYKPNWDDKKDTPELYDLILDPEENINVYNDPEYEQVMKEMRIKLRGGWMGALPKG